MSRFKLKPYSVQLYQQGNTSDKYDLSQIILSEESLGTSYFGQSWSAGASFIDIFAEYCQDWYTDLVNDQENEKTLSLADDPNSNQQPYLRIDSENNVLEGVLNYGVYGTEASHIDTDTGQREQDARSADEAVETPIPFLLHVPERNPRKSILVLESIGGRGAKTLVEQEVRKQLPNGVQYNFDPVKDDDVYSKIQQASEVVSVQFSQSSRLAERNDRFSDVFGDGLTNHSTTYEPVEGSISVDIEELQEWIENVDDDENPFNLSKETYERFGITIKDSGSKNTIDLINKNAKIVEVLDDIETEGGYPVPSDVSERTRIFINNRIPFAGRLDPQGALL